MKIELPPHDPIASTLSAADDRIVLSDWLPPQEGIVPRIRIGRRWISILWAIPIGAAALVLLIALAQSLRELPSVQAFIQEYPGIAQSAPSVDSGFPWWLQLQHFLNMLFMMFIIRAGIQILADHPRLYWSRDCTPGTDWFRFQHPVPKGRIWTSKDDSVTLPGWLGIPGVRHSIGLARWWHFSIVMLWTINGVAFYVLMFATGQWLRLVPVTWGVFPAALSTALQYASLNFPVDDSWTRYNGLQQLSYFITVFVAAPVSIAHRPDAEPGDLQQAGLARDRAEPAGGPLDPLHLVLLVRAVHPGARDHGVRYRSETEHEPHVRRGGERLLDRVSAFRPGHGARGLWPGGSLRLSRSGTPVWCSGPDRFMVGWIKGLSEWWEPNAQLTEQDISPHFWPNGTMPNSDEFDALVADEFAHYRLRVSGLVEAPREFSFADLKALPKQEQITTHFCIQGWSGVAKWGGVPMRDILDIVKPTPDARYAVFYSFSEGSAGGGYYDVHEIHNMRHRLTILAYEMNGAPVSVLHGAPLRLRCENELGFKMVKWIAAIEFVRDFADLGAGQGGYNEDHEFYGYRMPI